MRCRLRVAEPFTGEKVTLFSVTRCRATPHHRLRAELSRCGSSRRGSRSPPVTVSLPRPCFAALKGEAKVGVVPRGSPSKQVLPRTRKLSPLCTPSLSLGSPGLPVSRGVSGGGAALSPGFQLNLCPPEQIGAHSAAQSPERSFFFPLFLSPRKKKRLLAATQSQNLCR